MHFLTLNFEYHNRYTKLLCNSENSDIASCNKNNSEWGFSVFLKRSTKSGFFSKNGFFLKKKTKKNRWVVFLKKAGFSQPCYQCHSSSADCARVLFKPSKDLASLLACTQKKFLVGGCGFFVSDVISEVVFESFLLMLPGLAPNS